MSMVDTGFEGVRVGHWTDAAARTGCTVIRFDQPTVASGEVRGGAPATREFALLDPRRTVSRVDAVVLSGGSAFGLAACDGVMARCEAADLGFPTEDGVVPIVVGMSLFDLGLGDARVRPSAESGMAAWDDAARAFEIGRIGAGAGATVGKWRGRDVAAASGLGTATIRAGDLVVTAIVAVNAAGDVMSEPAATATRRAIEDGSFSWDDLPSGLPPEIGRNTTIGVVITNGIFTKTECQLLAEGAHDGLARAIFPAHTPADGDAFVTVSRPIVEATIGQARILTEIAVESATLASVGESGSG